MKRSILSARSLVLVALLLVASGAAPGQPRLGRGQQPAPPQQPPPAPGAPPTRTAAPSADEQAALQKVLQAADPQQRLTFVEEFLAKYPESSVRMQVYAAAAEAYEMQRNFDKAVEYGERALQVSPQYAGAMLLVADALTLGAVPTALDYEERLTKAENYARRALEVLPGMLANMPRGAETPEDQFNLQKQYYEAQPHAILGLIHLRRNQYAQAKEELKVATQLNQWRPEGVDFQRLGFAHQVQKEYGEAEAAFQRCVELGGAVAPDCQQRLERVQRIRKTLPVAPEKKPPE